MHVGLIMDGNGRWARKRGLPRIAGHKEGAQAVRRAVEAAPGLGIRTLTLYAFSADNWSRPRAEVVALMGLLEEYLERAAARCRREGVRLIVVGRRDRLRASLLRRIRSAERVTRHGRRLILRLAVDYSGRDAIVAAARSADEALDRQGFGRLLARAIHDPLETPPLDLVIRTSGEQRLSDFMLWESAYAELVFLDRLWPDFDGADLAAAVDAFRQRDRRFGALPGTAGSERRALPE